jgi:uncharacterized protein YegJ (DUF2314 family)
MSPVIAIMLLGLAGMLIYFSFFGRAGVAFDKDDPRLLAAKQRAKASLPQFWAALKSGDSSHSDFMLKFNLNHGLNLDDNESIWAYDIVLSNGKIRGNLANEPINEAFEIDQEIEIAVEAIDDWAYISDGSAQGHHVTRLMIEVAPLGTAFLMKRAMGL